MIDGGLQALDKALQIDPEYDDAMAYENLLIRERADLADTKEEYEKQIKIADDWVQKALATKKIKAEKKSQDRRRHRSRSESEVSSSLSSPSHGRWLSRAPRAPIVFCVPCYNRIKCAFRIHQHSANPRSVRIRPIPWSSCTPNWKPRSASTAPKTISPPSKRPSASPANTTRARRAIPASPTWSIPLMVAHILADMRMDVVAMETGLLHDVVEDTSVTVEQVRKEFGDEVARCVDGVTKLTKLDFFSRRRPAGGELPQDAARHGRTTSASSW